MRDILVLGIGNRLMMDDGIGVHVVEELIKRNTNSVIRYIIGETDIYFCLKQIEEASYIVIVDAACLNKEPGSISCILLEQVFNNSVHPISVHESHLLSELKMPGRSIDGMLIGIEPYEINYSPGLSSILQAQYFKIVEEIEGIISFLYSKLELQYN